jgi:hypothetical protein
MLAPIPQVQDFKDNLQRAAASLKMPVSRSADLEVDPARIVVAVGELNTRVGVLARVDAADPCPIAGYDAAAGAKGDGTGEGAAGEESHCCDNAGGGGFHCESSWVGCWKVFDSGKLKI